MVNNRKFLKVSFLKFLSRCLASTLQKWKIPYDNWKEEDLKKAIEEKNITSVRRASEILTISRKTLERKLKTGNVFKGPMGSSFALGSRYEPW